MKMSFLRTLRLALAIALVGLSAPMAKAGGVIEMMTTSGCSCCHAWAKHLRHAGFTVTVKDLAMGQLMRAKLDAGIPAQLAACHTAKVNGYVIEGHVPVRELQRLLSEAPDAIGLVVPGMPIGSPGMEAGNTREAYKVLLIKKDGSTEVFATYGG